jgi:hypothetical protein
MSRDSTQQHLQNLAGSTVSYGVVHKPERDDDVDSNEQDGINSQLGSLPKVCHPHSSPQSCFSNISCD